VAYANRQWTRFGIGKGMFSDMGRVYIRYGPPSEITQQVMPAGDETLTRELERIMYEEQRAVGDLRQKGLGGDQRPFEVWSYEGDIPVPFDVEPGTVPRGSTRRRLMFLFVDEQGLGTYTLRYTTE
jgi:GWxTD domain-containing protein